MATEFYGQAGIQAYASGQEDVVIQVDNVQKTYLLGIEGIPALRGVSLSIRRGEFVIIFGTSGGGKTSLLNIIGTIDKPTKGELRVNGTRITSNTTDKALSRIRLHDTGFVFQTFNLLGSMTALENVMMPMVLKGELDKAERVARATELLTRVGMGERLNHYPAMLSGGEAQRVTIARAIANKPTILLLDEPTGDLDTKNGAIVMKLLTDLCTNDGITMVMVTHDVNLKPLANRVLWMRDGKLQREEYNTAARREQALRELADEVKVIAPASDEVPATTYANTFMRDPSAYRPLRAVTSEHGRREIERRLAEASHEDAGGSSEAEVPYAPGDPPSTSKGGEYSSTVPTDGVALPPISKRRDVENGAGVGTGSDDFRGASSSSTMSSSEGGDDPTTITEQTSTSTPQKASKRKGKEERAYKKHEKKLAEAARKRALEDATSSNA